MSPRNIDTLHQQWLSWAADWQFQRLTELSQQSYQQRSYVGKLMPYIIICAIGTGSARRCTSNLRRFIDEMEYTYELDITQLITWLDIPGPYVHTKITLYISDQIEELRSGKTKLQDLINNGFPPMNQGEGEAEIFRHVDDRGWHFDALYLLNNCVSERQHNGEHQLFWELYLKSPSVKAAIWYGILDLITEGFFWARPEDIAVTPFLRLYQKLPVEIMEHLIFIRFGYRRKSIRDAISIGQKWFLRLHTKRSLHIN